LKILVALGGNAILRGDSVGTAAEQFARIDATNTQLVELVRAGHEIALTHGNGPQVGDILLANEMAKSVLPPMPLDVCGAESQGMVGYMIQQSLENKLRAAGLKKRVVTILTQTIVEPSDPAFKKPTKPIGPFYTAIESEKLKREKGWTMVSDKKRGYRRVVPSPNPVAIVEDGVVKQLFDAGVILIAAGGGGIPVMRIGPDAELKGVEAVIDKDLGAALLATILKVELLLILTEVDSVYLNYGTPRQERLGRLTMQECKRYMEQGQFPAGTMGPKVEAAVRFVESGGRETIITSLDRVKEALEGRAGTSFVRQ
jgi:carbamate kinase